MKTIKESDYFCEFCGIDISDDDMNWRNNTPVCTNCGTVINL